MTGDVGVVLRPEGAGEADAVAALEVDAFEDPVIAELIASLRSSDAWVDGLSFVAERADELVGHVLFTRSLLDTPERLVDVLVLSPLAVASSWQGRGIGSALMRHALHEVGTRDEPLVFLEGGPDYYRRFGFVAAGELGFRRPSLRIPEAAFQVMTLVSYEPWMTGTLVYAEAFWRHDCVGLRGEMLHALTDL